MKNPEKVAIVTGAGTGIGRQTALALLREGYAVSLAGRRIEKLQETVDQAGADRARALAVPVDVSDPASVRALFDKTREAFGRLDLLFNNAGMSLKGAPIDEIPVEDWLQLSAVNITGMFLAARAAFGLMRRQSPQGGRIINNGSISAHAPRPYSAPYTATKHAVTGLTKCTSLDGRPYDIACGQIDIGNARTEMAERMAKGVPQADLSIKVEPLMDVNHVGQAVVHMANLPLETNVQFMTIMATQMPFVGRG